MTPIIKSIWPLNRLGGWIAHAHCALSSAQCGRKSAEEPPRDKEGEENSYQRKRRAQWTQTVSSAHPPNSPPLLDFNIPALLTHVGASCSVILDNLRILSGNGGNLQKSCSQRQTAPCCLALRILPTPNGGWCARNGAASLGVRSPVVALQNQATSQSFFSFFFLQERGNLLH